MAIEAGWPCLNRDGTLRLRYNPFPPSPKQFAFLAWTGREALFGGGGGGGKMVALDTLIGTPDGWSTMGAVQVGDRVFDHDGKPTTVVWKSEVLTERTFEVVMVDGERIVAGERHQWNVATGADRKGRGRSADAWAHTRTVTTSELAALLRSERDPVSIPAGGPVPGDRPWPSEYRQIRSIVEVDPEPMQCIQVDNDRGLYRVGRTHLVTHNSICLLMGALQFVDVPGYNAMIFRRTITDLKLQDGLIDVSHDWLDPHAHWDGNKHRWTFPSGATLQFGYMNRVNSHYRYKSSQVQFIGFDETTEFPWEEQYLYMFSRLRRGVKDPVEAERLYGAAPDGLTLADVPLRVRGASNPGGVGSCVPHGDVLTVERGWVPIQDVNIGDAVYSVDPDGRLVESTVDQVHAAPWSGDMVHVRVRGMHMEMTPNHRVAKLGGVRPGLDTRTGVRSKFSLVQFDDLPGQATVLRSVEWSGVSLGVVRPPDIRRTRSRPSTKHYVDELPGREFCELLGWFLAEGSLIDRDKAISISQVKPHGRAALAAMLERCGFERVTWSEKDVVIYSPNWWQLFRSECGRDSATRRMPTWVKSASRDELQALLDAMMVGDGHWRGDSTRSGTYWTTSPQLADDFAEVALKCGYIVQQKERDRTGPSSIRGRPVVIRYPELSVNIKRVKSGGTELLTGNHVYDVATTTKRRSDVTREPFDGEVFCIGVRDTHNFILRQNGAVWVSGNSWVFDRFIDKDNPDRRPFLQSMLTDNPGIDADEYRKALAELPEVERLRLEEGSWDALEIPGALWSFRDIAHIDTDDPDDTADVRIIGVDPSVSAEGKNHDECGIVMGSLTNGRITVERDFSGHFHPDDWAKLVVREYHRHGCSRVVCEDNQGGALVFSAIGNAADAIGMDRPHVVKVRATESKEARAIPVIAAYRDGKVAHLLGLRGGRMEVQMTSWVPGIGASPDRVDALVWLVRNGLFGDGTSVTYHAPDVRDRLMRPRGPAIHSASGFRL